MEFYKGTMNGKEVVVVRSGIGKVNAGICTQILCDLYHVDAVINKNIPCWGSDITQFPIKRLGFLSTNTIGFL